MVVVAANDVGAYYPEVVLSLSRPSSLAPAPEGWDKEITREHCTTLTIKATHNTFASTLLEVVYTLLLGCSVILIFPLVLILVGIGMLVLVPRPRPPEGWG